MLPRDLAHGRLVVVCLLASSTLCAADDASLAQRLLQSENRLSSVCTVRILDRDDRGAIEYAAAYRNPVFSDRVDPATVKAPERVIDLTALAFGGVLDAVGLCDRVGDTPLTEDELTHGCAWRPMVDYLAEWNWDASEALVVAGSAIAKESFGNEDLGVPLVQPAVAYVHGAELWVRVEFEPAVSWATVDDEDGDGYHEFYGRMVLGAHGDEVLAQLRTDYLGRALTPAEREDRFFELASAWYPSRRTVVLEPELTRPWPNAETEPEVRDALGGDVFGNALAILKSNPHGTPIYNVFFAAPAARGLGAGVGLAPFRADAQAPSYVFHVAPTDAPDDEAARWGGSYESWAASLAPFRADVQALLSSQPEAVKGLVGREGWLCFRGDLEYLVAGDLRRQENERDPYPAIVDFANQLSARGIALLVAFIPTKTEVYPEGVSANDPTEEDRYVQPYCRKLIAELRTAGVDVVDLLTTFVAERRGPELLYQKQDTHWANRGVRLAADAIAERVRQLPQYGALSPRPEAFTTKAVSFDRLGDIVPLLPAAAQPGYEPATLSAEKVLSPDGSLYVDDPNSPVVMLGDSFTGVFELEDCKHAGLSAHLARGIGVPIDLIMAQGSGPTIRGRLARRGADAINAKRIVIWTVASRDLYNYWSPWKTVELP